MIIQDENSFFIFNFISHYSIAFMYENFKPDPVYYISVYLFIFYSSRELNDDPRRKKRDLKHNYPYVGGVLMCEEEVIELEHFLEKHICNSSQNSNDSKLVLHETDLQNGRCKSNTFYELDFQTKLSRFKVLSNKNKYWDGYIFMSEEYKAEFLNELKEVVAKVREQREKKYGKIEEPTNIVLSEEDMFDTPNLPEEVNQNQNE